MAIPFGIEGSDSLVNGVGEVFAAGERLVCEMMPLQIAPYSLDGIEIPWGRIAARSQIK